MMLFVFSILILLSVLCYFIAIYHHNLTVLYILKPGTMTIIITMAFTGAAPSFHDYAVWIIIGLIFSVFGDIFLMLPKDRFLYGLIAFLTAHVCYIVAFLHFPSQQEVSIYFTLCLLVVALLFFLKLTNGVRTSGGNKLLAAVIFYVVLISGMVWLAVFTSNLWIMAAAFLFYVSDATLAWDRFVKPLKFRSYIVMSTYFLAQYLFALSVYVSIKFH